MHTSYFGELEKELRKQILSGELPEGKPIPTEMELMSRYKLGRTTVRKALQKLVDSGMLHKVHGIGTFVIPREDWHQETVHLKVLLIVPGFLGRIENEDLFDRSLIAGVADYSYLHHASLEIHRQEPSAKKLFSWYRNLKISGIIWERPWEKYFPTIAELHKLGVPQVTVNRELDGIPSVFFDYERVLESVVNVFSATGRRKIIFCDMQLNTRENIFNERQKFFSDLMHRVNPDCPENIVYRIDRAKFSSAVADRIISEHPDLEGVVCSVTFLPVLLPVFREKLPGVPLVSFGENDLLNRDTDRIMNFISDSRENVGRKATELLEKLCRGKAEHGRHLVSGEFLVRRMG